MSLIKLSKLIIDYEIQLLQRGINDETVGSYAEAIKNGEQMPPITVFQDGDNLWVADGFHRESAHRSLGLEVIEAEILPGTKKDAIIFAATANVKNGRPMSGAEKKEAGKRLLKHLRPKNYREIGRRLAVSHSAVRSWDKEKSNGDCETSNNWKNSSNCEPNHKQPKQNGNAPQPQAPIPDDARPLFGADEHLDSAIKEQALPTCEICGQVFQGKGCPDCQPIQDPKPEEREQPLLIVSRAEKINQLQDETVDLIITSPPYNLGKNTWPMGGNGRQPREDGIGYTIRTSDKMPEGEYQDWQIKVFNELYRIASPGASFFYNHKARIKDGIMTHPMEWIGRSDNPWIVRQEIIWDRKSTHNHSASIFWPEDERIYWMTKGKPALPDHPIGMSTVWREFGPRPGASWHPAPFIEALPRMVFDAIGRDGITVLDPFAGSCTTIKVAMSYGYNAIGVDISEEYLTKAMRDNLWTKLSVS